MKGKIIAVTVVVFALIVSGGIVYFLQDSPDPFSYRVEDGYIYAKGVGKSGDAGSAAAKRAALDNSQAAILKGVYEEDIKTPVVSVSKEVTGPLSFLGIGKKVIHGSIIPSSLDRLSNKGYYRRTKEGKTELIKVIVKVRLPIN